MLHRWKPACTVHRFQVMNDAPAVASTDYMKLFAEQVRAGHRLTTLSRTGYGWLRSFSRENLRHRFEVDASYVVVAAALGEHWLSIGEIDKKVVADALPN
ncbi:hypothetical protein KCP76_14395 [Salmonella enterica subsp. enterica serovar Weltevreden]|nr:hypothetical protein KCP76_14395 [Salmonella enterica subsp. enterica serovar Weltevreden]